MVNSIVEFYHVQMKFHTSFVKIHYVEFWLIILFEDNRILDWQLQHKDVEEKNKLKLHWSEKEKGLLRGEDWTQKIWMPWYIIIIPLLVNMVEDLSSNRFALESFNKISQIFSDIECVWRKQMI